MAAQPRYADQANREVPLADFIPYSSHVTPEILKTRNGDYLRIWKVGGISFEAVDPVDILTRHNGFNQFVRSIAGGNFSVWTHKVRRKISDQLESEYDNAFSQELHDRYTASFAGYRMMANELYLTLIYRPQKNRAASFFTGVAKGIDALLSTVLGKAGAKLSASLGMKHETSLDELAYRQDKAIEELNDAAYQVQSSLKKFDLEPLTTYTHNDVRFSQPLEFLGYLLNGVWERVPLRDARICETLATSRIFFGGEKVEIRTPAGRRIGALLDFKDYPEFSEPGILNPILYDDYEYIETQSFTILNKSDAKTVLERQRNQLIAAEDSGTSQIQAMNDATDQLINGTFVMGEYHYSLAIFGGSSEEVSRNVAKARAALQDQGFQTAMVDVVADGAWFAQLPCNWRFRPREATISSHNFCGLSCFHNFSTGKRNGNPWGDAVTILKTPSGQPFYFNFHVTPEEEDSEDKKAPANTMIIGETGAGKTVLELFLLSEAMKFGLTGVVFDKDRGAEIAVRAMRGKYFAFKRGEPTGLNPFALDPTPRNVLFWESLVKKLVDNGTGFLSAQEEQQISLAVRTVAGLPKQYRRLSAVRQNLPVQGDNSLNLRLAKWCIGGSDDGQVGKLGWLLDNANDEIDLSTHRLYGFDDTEFLDDKELCIPVTMYLLYRTESMIDGRRFCYVMAEFWKRLSDEVFADFAKNKQKTIRKQNGFGIFDTQSPADTLDHPISRTMVEQSVTLIYLPNPRADRGDYVDGFKTSEAEFNIIKNLGENSRMFLVKQGHQSAIARLDLSGGSFDDVLNVLSGSTDNVELLEQIRAENGEDPDVWLPIFHEKIAMRRSIGKERKAA
jgi:type IV secretion system protein VirB4